MNSKLLALIFISFLLSSCLSEQAPREVASVNGNVEGSNPDNGGEVIDDGTYEAPYWYDVGVKRASLTLDYNNNKNHYLFGTDLSTYLGQPANFNSSYCLRVTFNTGAIASKPLLVRATPATTINYTTGKRIRYLRVNLASSQGNKEACKKPPLVSDGPPAAVEPFAYNSSEVCPTCLNIISSEQISLYKYESSSNALSGISTDKIPYGNLALRIDMNGNDAGNLPTCTDSACASEGFDCCVNGQCVNEGNVKSSAVQSDPDSFALAELEKIANPKWYLKYPEFYYICLEDPQNGGNEDPLDPEDPISEAEAHLARMKADYECVEEMKANSLESPFHRDPINEGIDPSTYQKCDIQECVDEATCPDMNYTNVMKRLYENCGCSETNLNDMTQHCPAYTYKLVYNEDALGNPVGDVTSVACVTPPSHDNQLPFQDLEVMVSSRSAPHRFFNKVGVELDPYDPASISGSTDQEGEPFQYLDNDGLIPLNGAFNMNSLMGQMNVSLSKARPAKKVDLEFDKVYYIAALEGTYTACPGCAKDSWFTNFSPYPTTNQGLGVRASGFTTSRDSWGTNSSFANYEDAIFGRACWLPPTMVPFGHSAKADARTQRLTRLKTQSALYVNGYQRDWFGFNKGALIGSFDGVTWFAIGKGRKVRATSDRLYLAINAPFADLASPTDHIVSVQEYDFITTAAEYDYHPEEEINSPFQNEAGLCQQFHTCETDSHCITKLGWEYSCVDVYQYTTKWPEFSPIGAEEIAGAAKTGGIAQFLQQGELVPGSSSKRCVYRGAGAPCRIDNENVDDLNARRAVSCAPNFYCASVNSADFNKEVARYAAPLESVLDAKNHYFGQDANMLGRPKDYITTSGGSALPNDIKDALRENIELIDPSSGGTNVGLCRPGKSLPSYSGSSGTNNWDQLAQDNSKDPQSRTDFISQISGCNSTLYTSMRYSSCPMLGEDGNYVHLSDEYVNIAPGTSFGDMLFSDREDVTKYYSSQQNMCGLEAIDKNVVNVYAQSEEQLRSKSAFRSIEARTLASSDVQIEPTFAQNACFRRAGSVCHTNYDCAPNYKHYEIIDLLHPDVFGNTPERKYWEEYLECSQEKREPILTSDSSPAQISAFNEYSLHNNRCGRPLGKDITLYTEDSPNADESAGLRTDIYGGFQPNNPNRYSRYASSRPLVSDADLEGPARVSAKRPNDPTWQTGDPNILTKNQWRIIHDTAARTCSGGNWVRKFADGSNDWTKNRLNLNVENFKCLNYKTPLMLTETPEEYYLTETELSKDRVNFCSDTGLGSAGCAQQRIPDSDSFTLVKPKLNDRGTTMRIDTDPNTMEDLWASNEWSFMQFFAYDLLQHEYGSSAQGLPAPVLEWDITRAEIEDDDLARQVIFTRIPTFIPFEKISDIRIDMESPASNNALHAPNGSCRRLCPGGTLQADGTCSGSTPADYLCSAAGTEWHGLCETTNVTWDDPNLGLGAPEEDSCYYMYDDTTRRLKVVYPQAEIDNDANYDNKQHSLVIDFTAPGTLLWEEQNAPGGAGITDDTYLAHRRSSEPGNSLFYLEKLAKLEYIGIPQMTYEPIFCNDIYQKMVPGIFKNDIETATDFIDSPYTFTGNQTDLYWNANSSPSDYDPVNAWGEENLKKVADQKLLAHEQIFSDNEFKCCLPLGSQILETEGASLCCSGATKKVDGRDSASGEDEMRCALPSGADLNVYFNKFVSGEGLSDEYLENAQPLTVDDFDPSTGAPITVGTKASGVLSKLMAIGEEVCASGKTTRGGAIAPYMPEPLANWKPANADIEPIRGIVDSPFDSGNNGNLPAGYSRFQEGFRWNHHIYCSPDRN